MDFNGNPGSPVWTFDSHTEYMLSLYGEIDSSSGDATVYHGDMIGSTMITSRLENDPPGQESVDGVAAVAYTAFGEHVELTGVPDANDPNDANMTIWTASIGGALPAGFPRYGYAGQHGYESGLLSRTGANPNLPPVTLQHLGWRWYDPSIGRFVQRDPIGLAGGLNVYRYAEQNPTSGVDPRGLATDDYWNYRHHKCAPTPPIRADGDPLARAIFGATSGGGVRPRGGYVGASGGTARGGLGAGIGAGWTIDEGFFFYCIFPGWYFTYGEEGSDWGAIITKGKGLEGGVGKVAKDNEGSGWGLIGGSVPVWGWMNCDGGIYVY